MSTRTRQPQQLAALTIGFNTYLMNPDAAMKVMQLMQKSVECERDLAHRSTNWCYEVRGTPRLEMCIVNAEQVRQPNGGSQPLAILGPTR